MVGARSLAMALNRLIDAGIDAANPAHRRPRAAVGRAHDRGGGRVLRRLAGRLPDRRLAARSDRARALADPRRRLRHLPVPEAVHVAVPPLARRRRRARAGRRLGRGRRATCPWQAWALGGAVATWVAGFDLFYALFDIDIDRAQGLHSWATRFGERGVFVGARVLHAPTVALLVLVGLGLPVDVLYWLGVAGVALLLAYEHSLDPAGRPAPPRRCVLHDERRDQRRVLRLRARRRDLSPSGRPRLAFAAGPRP